MHHRILIKIRADDAEYAESICQDMLEKSIDNKSSTGWDYVGDIINLSDPEKWKNFIKNDNSLQGKTVEDFAEQMKQETLNNLKGLFDSFKQNMEKEITGMSLKPKEAPLYLNHPPEEDSREDKEIYYAKKQYAAKILNNELKPVKLNRITTPKKLAEIMANALSNVMQSSDLCMPMYYLNKAKSIYEAINNPEDEYYNLDSSDMHFYDATHEHSEGENTYYMWCDRHF